MVVVIERKRESDRAMAVNLPLSAAFHEDFEAYIR